MNGSIFSPHYNIMPEIDALISDIDRQRWLVENMLLMPRHEAWLRREVSVRRAAGTTRIEGASMDEAAVNKLLTRASGAKLTEDEQANINAIQAYEFIDFLSDQQDIPIDELAIRQLNRYFMGGFPGALTPGTYRKGENTVGNYTPPNQGDVPSLMRSFALWLREDQEELHPLLKAGIAHIHFVAIHPFWGGNRRTARGLATLVLQRSPFDFRKLLSLEDYLFDNRDDYFGAIERTLGTGFTPEYDATPWLDFFTSSVRNNVYYLTASLTEWHRMMEDIHKDGAGAGLAPRQVDGHIFAIRTGQITRADYIEITGVSPVTASRDLAHLVRMGLLAAEGRGRARRYYPTRADSDSQRSGSEEQLPLPEEQGA